MTDIVDLTQDPEFPETPTQPDPTADVTNVVTEAGDITHGDMVAQLAKPGDEIAKSLDTNAYSILHQVVTGAINSGRIVDNAKKQFIYGKPLGLTGRMRKQAPAITAEQAHLLHMAIGVYGEAAELLEAVFNHVDLGLELDMENVVEELGDLEFYMEGFRQGVEVSRETTLDHNIAKLAARYEGHNYSDEAAQERADKA